MRPLLARGFATLALLCVAHPASAECVNAETFTPILLDADTAPYIQRDTEAPALDSQPAVITSPDGKGNCPDGYTPYDFDGTDICYLCARGYEFDGVDTCLLCPRGASVHPFTNDCRYPCTPDEYFDLRTMDCLSCPPGYLYNPTNRICVFDIGPGFTYVPSINKWVENPPEPDFVFDPQLLVWVRCLDGYDYAPGTGLCCRESAKCANRGDMGPVARVRVPADTRITITSVTGQVRVSYDDGSTWQDLAAGTELLPGAMIETGLGGAAEWDRKPTPLGTAGSDPFAGAYFELLVGDVDITQSGTCPADVSRCGVQAGTGHALLREDFAPGSNVRLRAEYARGRVTFSHTGSTGTIDTWAGFGAPIAIRTLHPGQSVTYEAVGIPTLPAWGVLVGAGALLGLGWSVLARGPRPRSSP